MVTTPSEYDRNDSLCCLVLFVTKWHEHLKCRVALVEPVVGGVWLDTFPFLLALNTADALETFDDGQLLLAVEVVSNVIIVDFALALLGGVLNEERNGNTGVRVPEPKILPLSIRRCFTGSSLVPAKIENVNAGELIDKAGAESIHIVAINERAVGDEANDAFVRNAVACPSHGTNVSIVEIL